VHASGLIGDGDRLAGHAVGGTSQRGEERFDVAASIQLGQRFQFGVDLGEELAEPG